MKICTICGSDDLFLYLHGVYDDPDTNVLECRKCGLQFLDPFMSEKEENEYYSNYYLTQKSRHFKEMSLKDIQTNAYKHYLYFKDVYSELVDGKGKMLEIGCGTGGFLKFAREINPDIEIHTVEKSESNIIFLKDKEINDFQNVHIYNDLEELPEMKFDIIIGFAVFEHLRNGRKYLSGVKKWLSQPDGMIAFNIPNKGHALISLYEIDEFKKFQYMKQHYYTYSENSFDILAQQTGFKILKFNYVQMYGLDNHLSWLKNQKPMDFSKYTKILSDETIRSYNQDLISNKKTDLMMVILKLNS